MRNRLGIYYAFLAESDQVNWIDCLERTKAAGLDVLEMSAPKLRALSTATRAEIASRASDLGISLSFATALTPTANVSSPDPAVRREGIRLLREDLRMAAEMRAFGVGGILTGVGKVFPAGIEWNRNRVVDLAAESLKEVAKFAEDQAVNLGAEVVNRFETPLVNTCAECMRLVEAVDSPRLGVHLDSFHMNIEEADLPGAILTAGRRLIHFHACENDRSLPGHGHIDWESIAAALKQIGYRGAVVMECLPGPYGSVASRLNIWRKLSADVDGELKTAAEYLRKLGN